MTVENLDVRWHTGKKQSGICRRPKMAIFEAVKRPYVGKWLKLRLDGSIRPEKHMTKGKAM